MTESAPQPFDWTVRPSQHWPPQANIKFPFSLTRVEIARSCALRVVFEASRSYEPLVSFDARIGTAMHNTLEHFAKHPPQGEPKAVLQQVRQQFSKELQLQREEANTFPREKGKPESQDRIDAATTALLQAIKSGGVAASGQGLVRTEPETVQEDGTRIHVERWVGTRDKVFAGRVDRAVKDDQGLSLYDYKSSMLTEVPERYARQLQMYTEMWLETYGERADRAFVVYPLTGKQHAVDVSRPVTRQAMTESREVIAKFREERPAEELATPGAVCKVCNFRPWCEPFWEWTAAEGRITDAQERSGMGFQGKVVGVSEQQGHWVIQVSWHSRSTAMLMVPLGLMPHLKNLQVGSQIRVLNARLQGQFKAPRAIATAWSEVFLVEP